MNETHPAVQESRALKYELGRLFEEARSALGEQRTSQLRTEFETALRGFQSETRDGIWLAASLGGSGAVVAFATHGHIALIGSRLIQTLTMFVVLAVIVRTGFRAATNSDRFLEFLRVTRTALSAKIAEQRPSEGNSSVVVTE